MRPNLAFGPIDSIAQYLLYVSVVVLGVLLPLLIQRWRKSREESRLLGRTLLALREELTANRKRMLVTYESFEALSKALEREYEHYMKIWETLREADPATLKISPPPAEDVAVGLAAPVRTAWEVAHLSHALPLMPSEQLSVFTRAYHLQSVFEEGRALYLDISFKAEALAAPMDLTNNQNVESRLQSLAVTRGVVRYQSALVTSVVAAYDAALGAFGGG